MATGPYLYLKSMTFTCVVCYWHSQDQAITHFQVSPPKDSAQRTSLPGVRNPLHLRLAQDLAFDSALSPCFSYGDHYLMCFIIFLWFSQETNEDFWTDPNKNDRDTEGLREWDCLTVSSQHHLDPWEQLPWRPSGTNVLLLSQEEKEAQVVLLLDSPKFNQFF